MSEGYDLVRTLNLLVKKRNLTSHEFECSYVIFGFNLIGCGPENYIFFFAEQSKHELCVLSASGTISNASLSNLHQEPVYLIR